MRPSISFSVTCCIIVNIGMFKSCTKSPIKPTSPAVTYKLMETLVKVYNMPRPINVQTAVKPGRLDRKSTRLNSSHVAISYAVFCLIKKKVDRGRVSVEVVKEASADELVWSERTI